MKTWWTEKGWPWLKGNWWVLLILPVITLAAAGMFLMRFMGTKTVVVDPTAAADERARLEAETRSQQLEAEKARLAAELVDLRAEHDALRLHFERRLADEVEALRADPEKLRQAMLEAGRPQRPR
jgi:flagellar basal body-associated protein FliL